VIVVDTTVLVYAVGEDHALREPNRRVVAAITDGAIAATTIAGAIQEFAHVRARRYGRADSTRLARRYVDLLTPLLPVKREDLLDGLDLFEQHPRLSSFDAALAAVAANREVEALVSSDRAFGSVPGLAYVDPGAPEFEQLF
jgi:uncharacterized protein